MNLIVIYGIIAVVILLIVIVMASYVKAPPSIAYIISGLSKNPRSLTGKGGFRVPFFERLDKVYLGQGSVNVRTGQPVPTYDYIDITVDSEVKIRVIPNDEGILLASKNFLNMTIEQIAAEVKETLQGNLREMVGTLTLTKLITDRDGFSEKVKETAGKDMARLGIEILSYNIQEISEREGLIQNLGADNTWKIKKDAANTKANSQAEIAMVEAQAKKRANDIEVEAQTEIEIKNNDLALKKFELKKIQDTQKAVAEAAFDIQKQEQQKEINTKTVDAEIIKTKREQILKEERIKITKNELEASVKTAADYEKIRVETMAAAALENKKREAEAELYKIEQDAKAAKAKAEADAFAQKQEAEGKKAIAEADAYKIEAAGKAEASAISLKGKAEAEAIEAKGLAEAEAMEKKAEAFSKYGEAAVMEMMLSVLPSIAKSVAEPMSAIKDLRIYGSSADGAAQVTGQVPAIMKQVMDTMTDITGVEMSKIVQTNTIDAKTNKNISLDGAMELSKEITTLTE